MAIVYPAMGQKEIHPLGDRKIRVDFNYERDIRNACCLY